jgi:histidyl-tRNA synthetase
LLLLIQELGLPVPSGAPDAYAVIPDAASLPQALLAIEALRAAGVSVQMNAGGGNFKSQFKKADASGARFALVFGGDELARGTVSVKALRDTSMAQVEQPLDAVNAWAGTLLAASRDA